MPIQELMNLAKYFNKTEIESTSQGTSDRILQVMDEVQSIYAAG